MRRLLVPTDFSADAMKAVTYSVEIARKAGAAIYLLHVVELVTDRIRQPYSLHDRLHDEIMTARRQELNTLREELIDAYPDLTIETKLANGNITTTILEHAEKLKIDIIVMGTQGAGGLKEVLWGTVTASIIRRTKIPVLAVPFEYQIKKPEAIVFATNQFEKNKLLLKRFIELAGLFNTVVHVVIYLDEEISSTLDYHFSSEQMADYLLYLKQAYPDIKFSGEVLEGKNFEDAIEEYDSKNGVDMIAMVTYPKNSLERLLKISVTRKMALHSKIPVLALPAK